MKRLAFYSYVIPVDGGLNAVAPQATWYKCFALEQIRTSAYRPLYTPWGAQKTRIITIKLNGHLLTLPTCSLWPPPHSGASLFYFPRIFCSILSAYHVCGSFFFPSTFYCYVIILPPAFWRQSLYPLYSRIMPHTRRLKPHQRNKNNIPSFKKKGIVHQKITKITVPTPNSVRPPTPESLRVAGASTSRGGGVSKEGDGSQGGSQVCIFFVKI